MSDLKTEREVLEVAGRVGMGAKAEAEARRVAVMAIFMVGLGFITDEWMKKYGPSSP
jgi:hypothetical protein